MERRPTVPRRRPLAQLSCALLLACACAGWARADEGGTAAPAQPKAEKAREPQAKPDPLVIGVYAMSLEQVVDGDTIRLPDGQGAIRILGIDTEELYHPPKGAGPLRPWAKGFDAYARAQRGDRKRPVKYGTPAGEAARAFLRQLAKGCSKMRLERDFVGQRPRGTFGRVLAHVFLLGDDGTEHNVAEVLLRAGHSPYFMKYGRSARFDAAFSLAQDDACKARRGIWGSGGPDHYPDYLERLAWWSARAAQIDRWSRHKAKPDHVTLGEPEADRKLKALVGKQAVVFGAREREIPVKGGDKRIFLLSHERRRGLPLVVFDADVAESIDARERFHSMYVTVRGKITLYKGRPQIVIEQASQISTE